MPGLGQDLVVNLAGSNAKLKSAIAESKSGLKGFASSAAGFLNPVTAGLTAVAGAAVAAGIAIWGLEGNINKLDAVAKNAAKTGLSGKFLQQLEFAADQSGVSTETLIGGIKKLTIAIGKADPKPFEEIGLSLADLQGMSPEKQFAAVADKISQIPTAAGRAAAAVKIFGKSGIEMVTLLNGGVEGLNGLLERANELGIGVDAEGLKRVEAANDAIGQMKAAFGALIDQVTVGLAPTFTLVATTIADMIPPVTRLMENFNNLEDKAQFLSDLFRTGFVLAIETIAQKWQDMLKDLAVKTIKTFQKLTTGLASGTLSGAVGGINGMLGDSRRSGRNVLNAQRDFDKVLSQITGPAKAQPPQPATEPVKAPVDGAAVASAFGGLFDALKPMAAGIGQTIGTKITEGKIALGAAKGTLDSMFSGERKDAPQKQMMQFAGAMQRGSAEAYSTIVNAMRGAKDPVVKATEKSTKAIVGAIKANKPQSMKVVASIT